MIATVDLRETGDLVASKMGDALRQVGAFYLRGHDIDQSVLTQAYEAGRQFHALDLESKQRSAVGTNGLPRGWHDGKRAGKGTYESFEIGQESRRGQITDPSCVLHGPNVWPKLPGFRESTYRCYEAMLCLARRLLDPLCEGLGLPKGYLQQRSSQPCCLLRVLNYDAETIRDPNPGIAAHTDFEAFTILSATSPGLELCDRRGTWRLVEASEAGDLLVLAGDLLELVTAGSVESPLHRAGTQDRARQSLAFFFGLDADATVEPRLSVPQGREHLYQPTNVGAHLARMLILSYPSLRERHESGHLLPELSVPRNNPYKGYKVSRISPE